MITAVRNGKYITISHFKVIDTPIDDMDSVGSDIEDEVEDVDLPDSDDPNTRPQTMDSPTLRQSTCNRHPLQRFGQDEYVHT